MENIYNGKNITVVGLARSGVGAANQMHRLGAVVTINDSRPESALPLAAKLLPGIKKALGEHPDQLFTGADLIIISPGVPQDIPPLIKARAAGVEIIGELEFAYRLSDSPFLAITGTNGKSTATTLAGLMLAESGKNVFVGGNLGNALTEELENLTGRDVVVAEVSSFQLEAIRDFRPRVSTVLNITQDHLDRYDGMEGYTSAKAAVFANQAEGDTLVLNLDDAPTAALAPSANCRVVFFSRKQTPAGGVYVNDGMVVSEMSGTAKPIMPVSEIRIKGVHNLENALAAAAVTLAMGATAGAIAKVLREFPGLEHRLEFVRELDGVTYINDSKGTNVGAVEKSLESFHNVILIAGGLDKHSDFSVLAPLVRDRVKRLVLIGKAADVIADALGSQTDTVRAGSLAEAVLRCREVASPGDMVLLSPACASFDMFKDFEDRGRQFKAVVMALGAKE